MLLLFEKNCAALILFSEEKKNKAMQFISEK